ncbi:hypothetical protein CPI84_00590 [Erwinia pyrifoliae]|nr:hypothetical protein CPI84_00590 [Erwinia pyrifoliae]
MKSATFNLISLALTIFLAYTSSIHLIGNENFPDLFLIMFSFFGFRSLVKMVLAKILDNFTHNESLTGEKI